MDIIRGEPYSYRNVHGPVCPAMEARMDGGDVWFWLFVGRDEATVMIPPSIDPPLVLLDLRGMSYAAKPQNLTVMFFSFALLEGAELLTERGACLCSGKAGDCMLHDIVHKYDDIHVFFRPKC